MREIKFRAWHTEWQMMFDVLSIDFAGGTVYVQPLGDNSGVEEIGLDEVELMQYTGLNDCDGVEIYKGYILQKGKIVLVVKFGKYVPSDRDPKDSGHQGFYADAFENQHDLLRRDIHAWIINGAVVIGNIYENPELLAGAK